MAQKLNKKLVFVVGSLLILLVLGGAVTLVLRYRYDSERHIRAGDELVAAGQYRKAADAYGRAVAKKATNLDYLAKFREAILRITPETENQAREDYFKLLSVIASEARAARDDNALWRTFLEAFRNQAEAFDNISTWKQFSDRCDDMQRTVSEDGAAAALARLYRGYAGFRRADSLNDTERAVVVADLDAALKSKELTPAERDLGLGSLARLAVRERAIAGGAGRSDRLESTQVALDSVMARLDVESPNGLRASIAKFELALSLANGKPKDPGVTAAAEALAKVASSSDDSLAIIEVAQVLLRGGVTGLEEAQSVLGDYVGKNPTALLHRRSYGITLRSSDIKSARRELQAVVDATRPTTGLLSALYESNRTISAIALFDLAFDEAERSSADQKEAGLKEAIVLRDAVAKLIEGSPDTSALLRADGKIALLKGDSMGAIIKFNEIFKKGSQIDLELYILSALANMRVQEVGRALELVNGGLVLSPGNIALLKLRARLELTAARTNDAISTLRGVVDAFPEDTEAKELLEIANGAQANDPTIAGAANAFIDSAEAIQKLADAKDFDGARKLLEEAKKKFGANDVRIWRIAVAVEVQANNIELARKLTRDALAVFPTDTALVRFNAVLSSEDIVDRVIALSEGAVEDPKERAVMTYLRLLQTGQTMHDQADRDRRLGLASAEASEANAARLTAAAKEWRVKAEQADRAHPAFLEVDFNSALEKKDYAAAEMLAKLAEQSSRDRTQAPIFRARALLTQEKYAEAAQVLERSIESGVDASTIYRTLGAALEQMGNIDGALRNYEEAYKRRPADMTTVRLLVGVLVRSGSPARGLEVLRQARSLAGFDDDVGNTWLVLEQQVGDRRTAQRLRENRYRVAPIDSANAIVLASMLAISAPEREDVTNEVGKVVYSDNQWNLLEPSVRVTETDRVRDEWRKRAETIYLDILAREPENLDAAAAYASMLRTVGRMTESEQVLVTVVGKGGTALGWRGLVVLGQLQIFLDAEDRARASFAEAIKREDPKTRDASRSIVDMLMGIERYKLALVYLEPLVTPDSNSAMHMRLAECYLRLARPDDSRRTFDASVGTGPRDLGTELLDGAIYVAQGDALRLKVDTVGARAAYEQAIAPYQRAKLLAPSIPQAFIQDSMVKRKLFELTGDRTRGEEALAAADRATALGATFFPACGTRAEVLVALGDINGAVTELDRYLRLVPTSVDARRRLVDLLFSSNSYDRAEEALRAAISYAPGEAGWHFTLGDLLAKRGRLAEAALCYTRADKLQPDAQTFFRSLDARIRARDFRGAIEVCRSRGDLVRDNPVARAYLGAALVALGEKGDGLTSLRESFAVVKKDYDAGVVEPMQQWYAAVRLIFAPALLDDAEKLLMEVSAGDPTPVGWDYLSFLALGNDSAGPARVIRYLEPLADRDYSKIPGFGAILYDRLGTSYYLTGRCPDAVVAYEKALKLTPGNDAVLNNYAYLCVDCLKDSKKALPSARLAVQLKPTRGEYLDTLAFVLIAEKQFQEGLDYADRAGKFADSASVQLHRAMALHGLNRDSAAREALTAASAMNPDPPTKASIAELLSTLK